MVGDRSNRSIIGIILNMGRNEPLLARHQWQRASIWWSILRNSGMVLASNVTSRLLVLLATALIARRLGPEQFGWYSLVLTYVGLVAVLPDLGIEPILTREMARNPQRSEELMGAGITLRLVSVVVSVVAGFIGFRFLGYPRSLDSIMALALVYVVTYSLGTFAETPFRARLAMAVPTAAKVMAKGLFLVLVIVGLGYVGEGLLLIAVVGFTIVPDALATAFVLMSAWRLGMPSLAIGWKVWKPILAESWPLGLMAVCVMVYVRVGVVMLSRMSTPQAVGNYAAALMLAEGAGGISMALAVSLLPVFARSAASGQTTGFWRAYQQSFRGVMFLLMPVSVFVTLYAEQIIELIYATRYEEAAQALRLLIWAQVFASAGVLYTTALTAAGRQRVNLWLSMASAGINVVVNVMLIPSLGVIGAAIATICAYGTGGLILVLGRENRLYITPLFRASVIPALASLVFVLIAGQMRNDVILGAFVCGAVYVAGVVVLYKTIGGRVALLSTNPGLKGE